MSDVRVSFIEAGFTKHLEAVSMLGGRWKTIRFPASVAVIEHPREGVILFDTGYSARFQEQTKHFPNRFYSLITPVTIAPEHTALAQLAKRGISVRDVRHVILSHFHADHIGGACDFPFAKYIYRGQSYRAVRDRSAWGALRAGFLSGLLPQDFTSRGRVLEDKDFVIGQYGFSPYDVACDLFGDGRLLVVDLPGHAAGQIGLLVRAGLRERYFLVADACWGERSYRELRSPNPIVRAIFDDWGAYKETLGKIQSLSVSEPTIKIVPCHCDQTLAELTPSPSSVGHVHV